MNPTQRASYLQQVVNLQRNKIATGALKTPVDMEQDQLLAKCEAISGDLRKALTSMQGKVSRVWRCVFGAADATITSLLISQCEAISGDLRKALTSMQGKVGRVMGCVVLLMQCILPC